MGLLFGQMAIALFCALLPASVFAAQAKSELLSSALALKQKNNLRLQEIDIQIGEILESRNLTTKSIGATEKELTRLQELKREHLLRQEFFDRLAFQIDSHYQGGNSRDFVRQRLLSMAQIDTQSSTNDSWKFLTYLSVALAEIPEPSEDVIDFISDFVDSSTIRNPIKPQEYMAKRNYSNGSRSFQAKPASIEQVGDEVAQDINVSKPLLKPAQLESPVLKTVPDEELPKN